jgi:hypothetical protein
VSAPRAGVESRAEGCPGCVRLAVSATAHCLTGCAIGEVLGLALATAIGLDNFTSIAIAVVLAFFFGYSLTMLPLLRAGMALSVALGLAFASDTLSIVTMEVIDNAIILVVPGAMDAGLDEALFWGSLAFALVVAFSVTMPLNYYLIKRGRGHAVLHTTTITRDRKAWTNRSEIAQPKS